MIDFRTRKTRIRVLQSIIYLIVISVIGDGYSNSDEFLINLLQLRKINDGISGILSYSTAHGILGWILLMPLWIYWLLMPLYRSIKRWVSRGQ
jgi:hypothetical protein